jgi:hypothetical protein
MKLLTQGTRLRRGRTVYLRAFLLRCSAASED